jgi:hypothetical protein
MSFFGYFLLLCLSSTCNGIVLPRVSYQQQLNIPVKGSSPLPSGEYPPVNVIFVAEEGHSVRATRNVICKQVANQFDLPLDGQEKCAIEVTNAVRRARGLAMQHPSYYSDAVRSLEGALLDSGIYSHNLPRTSVYHEPTLASFIRMRIKELSEEKSSGELNSLSPITACEVGFGAGHSSLLFLSETSSLNPSGIVFSFEVIDASFTVPAHDLVDIAFPNRLRLLLGDGPDVISQLPHYYPDARCNILLLSENSTYNDTLAHFNQFAPLVAKNHIVILPSANIKDNESFRAWKDAENQGVLEWEGSSNIVDGGFVFGNIKTL